MYPFMSTHTFKHTYISADLVGLGFPASDTQKLCILCDLTYYKPDSQIVKGALGENTLIHNRPVKLTRYHASGSLHTQSKGVGWNE